MDEYEILWFYVDVWISWIYVGIFEIMKEIIGCGFGLDDWGCQVMMIVFQGLKVIEFFGIGFVFLVGQLLVDMGVDVVMID